MAKINVKGVAMKAAGTTAGAVAAAALNKLKIGKNADGSAKSIGSMKPATRGLIKIALGAFAPQFLLKGKKNEMIESAASGFIAVGGLELANSFIKEDDKKFTISGIGDLPQYIGEAGATISFDEDYSSGNTTVSGLDSNEMV